MNAVIYARYSSHGQTEQSIEGQLRDNYEWAQRQGITVVGEYIDRHLTGTTDQRPDFQRMMQDAAKRQFELVIVWKLDRFARNRYDSATYKARLKKYGVKVVSVKENITDSPEGIILEGLLESMAEYYSANLSQNVKRGQRESLAKGNFVGGPIPYGYRSANGKLLADDKTAPIIRYVFDQYAHGVPKKEIIDDLNRRGIRNRRGQPLNYTSFQRALTNPIYIGQYTYNGEVIHGLAEPLIDTEIFDAVQRRIKAVSRAPAAAKAKVDYLLQGKAFCGLCGAPMIGESGRSHTGTKYHYYNCAKKKKSHTCPKKNERKDFIEWYVVEQTVQYVLTPERAAYVAKAVVEEYEKEFSDTRITDLEKALQRINMELDKLVDALVDAPKVAHKRIYEKIETLEAQKADIEVDVAKLRIARGIQLTEKDVRSWLKQFCTGDPMDPEFRKRIIDVFITSVYLYDDRVITFYNIRNGEQVSFVDLASSDLPKPPESSDLDAYGSPQRISPPDGGLILFYETAHAETQVNDMLRKCSALRHTIYDYFLAPHGKRKWIYDYSMMFLIALSVVPLAFKTNNAVFTAINDLAAVVFLIDYIFRWSTADLKLKRGPISFVLYPFSPLALVDLLALLSCTDLLAQGFRLLKLFRLFRTFRVFRAFKMLRYSKSIAIIVSVMKKQAAPLMAVGTLAIGYIIISALVIFNVEPDTFHTFFDAVYWATVSLTTVGYGDIYPVSTWGRFIAMLSSFVGIAIVALPSGIITAGYMDEIKKE